MRTWLRRGIGIALWLGVVGVAAAFVFAWLLPQEPFIDGAFDARDVDHPGYRWSIWVAFAIRTLTFHAGLGLLGVTLVALLVRRHVLGWAALLLAVTLLGPTLWQARPKGGGALAGSSLTVASFNLRASNPTPAAAADFVAACAADVIVLQEYTHDWDVRLRPRLTQTHSHVVSHPHRGYYGIAVFSRVPITGRAHYYPPLGSWEAPQLRCTLRIDDRPVTLWALHLLGPHHPGAIEHQKQFHELHRRLAGEKGPVIAVGDFNFTGYSDMAHRLEDLGLRDALDLAGRGLATTWPADRPYAWVLYPGFRIDHLYLTPDLTASAARTTRIPGSDHHAARATVGFRQ